jgi:YggT family protein
VTRRVARVNRDLAADLPGRAGMARSGRRREKDSAMMAIYGPLKLILDVAFFIMIAHIIMSWLINFQVLNLRQQVVASIWEGLNRLLEPIYQPIRNILPDTRPLDLAPLVAIIIVISLRDFILPTVLFG